MLGHHNAFGEIDIATAPALLAALRDTIDQSDTEKVVVDCSRVTFADSALYDALSDASAYANDRGHSLLIRDPSPRCERLLRLCDWSGVIEKTRQSNENAGAGRLMALAGALLCIVGG